MTDSHRHEGGYPQQENPTGPPQQDTGYPQQEQAAGYPPPPAYAPAAPVGHGVPAGHAAPARSRRPAALVAAVALAAALVGGGTSYAIGQFLGKDGGTVNGVSGTNVSRSDAGTVSGVVRQVLPSIVEFDVTTANGTATGSGVIISSGGEVLTNNHVVAGATSIKVRTSDGRTYGAKTVGTDPDKDLALVKLSGAGGLRAAALGDSSKLSVGDQVVAVGSPEGLTGTVTSGIVSALNRDVTVPKSDGGDGGDGGRQQWQQDGGWPFEFGGRQFNGDTGSSKTTYKAIQTDASLNPGNSGGGLFDMNGNLVGINSAIYSPSTGQSGAGSVGLGFAIPVDTVKKDLGALRDGGSGGAGNGRQQEGGDRGGDGFFGTLF
ncbi:S1C family serine protease [Streptomyces sp. NRRL S-87]|uniref:S1C family serine protease n=1 Tax=Streptomyces sp. NRRL S-87 TaxID=1463920 RepID=UPI0007C51AD1|nr:trypsin-like peptidase domain-containing protein [Streptomyces sp. NRRL S-87]